MKFDINKLPDADAIILPLLIVSKCLPNAKTEESKNRLKHLATIIVEENLIRFAGSFIRLPKFRKGRS